MVVRRVEGTRKWEGRRAVGRVSQRTKGRLGGMDMSFLSRSSILVLLILLLAAIVMEGRGADVLRTKEKAMGVRSGIPETIGFKLRDHKMRDIRLRGMIGCESLTSRVTEMRSLANLRRKSNRDQTQRLQESP